MNVNYKFKDRLFRALFGSEERKENLLSLYNALNDTDYQNLDDLYINTIDDVIYMGMKNDVSCIIDNYLSLYEHQSTYNPNMPLRGLLYFGKLYDKYIKENEKNIFSSRIVKIPTPQYYVFYNGEDDKPESTTLRLSDAFEAPIRDGQYEWTAKMLNINYGKNKELMEKCQVLKEYSIFTDRIRTLVKQGKDIRIAVDEAVDTCIEEGILSDYLLNHKSEVKDMVLTEYDEKKTMELLAKEERTEGRAEVLIDLVKDGLLSASEAAKRLSMSEKKFRTFL